MRNRGKAAADCFPVCLAEYGKSDLPAIAEPCLGRLSGDKLGGRLWPDVRPAPAAESQGDAVGLRCGVLRGLHPAADGICIARRGRNQNISAAGDRVRHFTVCRFFQSFSQTAVGAAGRKHTAGRKNLASPGTLALWGSKKKFKIFEKQLPFLCKVHYN